MGGYARGLIKKIISHLSLIAHTSKTNIVIIISYMEQRPALIKLYYVAERISKDERVGVP